jgi:uncharacterized protein (DUF433 family)
MNWHDHITSDPEVLTGKPVIKGTRLSIEQILGLLENRWREIDIQESYPRGRVGLPIERIRGYSWRNRSKHSL